MSEVISIAVGDGRVLQVFTRGQALVVELLSRGSDEGTRMVIGEGRLSPESIAEELEGHTARDPVLRVHR